MRPHWGQSVTPVSAASAFGGVDLGRRQIEVAAGALLALEPRHDDAELRTGPVVPGHHLARERRTAATSARPSSASSWRIDVGHRECESVSLAACTSDRSAGSSARFAGELGFECRLLLHRLEFADVEFVALLGERGDLVHQRLGLARGDDRLQLAVQPLEVAGDLGATLLVVLDLGFESSDPGLDACLAAFPRSELAAVSSASAARSGVRSRCARS